MDLIQFGIVLKAFDQMSGVFRSAAGRSMGEINRLDARVSAFSDRLEQLGTKALGDGALLAGLAQRPIAAFADAEQAATNLKVSMLGAGNVLDARYGKISAMATDLGNTLPGTTADFQNMMSALVKQGISYDAILGGVGKSAAYLGVLMKKPPEEAAIFAAKMQDATGTVENDMMGLMDTIQRATYLGVDDSNMLAFYTKMTPAMDTMRRKGADAAKEFAPFAVMFDQMGMQGEASGNALRKAIQLGMDTKKVAKANAELASKGIKLDFTDGKGEFGGMANLMAQLDKLKSLNTVDRLKALKEIFGDDAETLQILSKVIDQGAEGYNKVVDKMAAQATLQQRVNLQLGTLKSLWDAASGTFTNALASMGEAVAPELKALTEWLGEASGAMQTFIADHPRLAKAAGIAVGGLAALLLVGGALALTLGTVSRLAGYALGPLGKLGGLLGKKGAAGAAGDLAEEAADKLGVQRVWVTNWPNGGFDLGDNPGSNAPDTKPDGKKGRLARIGQAVKNAPGALLAGGRAALAAPTLAGVAAGGGASIAAAAGMVASAGAAGYAAGTAANAGITAALTAANGGKERTLGTWLYDKFHGDADARALAPTMLKPPAAPAVPLVARPVPVAPAAPLVARPAPVAPAAPLVARPAPVALAAPLVARPAPVTPAVPLAPTVLKPPAATAPQPVPLSAAAAAKSDAQSAAGKTVTPQVTLHYTPTLTIQGDPLPGQAEKFRALLVQHRDDLLRMVNQAVEQKARVAY